jgi:hypothetical protein
MVKEKSTISPVSARSLGGSSTINSPQTPETAAQQQPPQPLSSKATAANMTESVTAATKSKNIADAASPISPTPPSNSNPNGNATTTNATTNNSSTGVKKSSTQPQLHIEYNPRWKGYMYIVLSSLINLASICNIPKHSGENSGVNIDNTELLFSISSVFDIVNGTRGVALSFSIVTFVYSFLIVLMDRLQICSTKFHYMKSYNGSNVEGISLVFGTLYSIIAVAYVTQVRGIAYLTLNIYFSVWLILISFIYTLNKWSTSKDILSIAELTGISTTLKSWYVIFISSMVVTGTSINMLVVLSVYEGTRLDDNENVRAATLGIVFGFCSSLISLWMILSHYNFIECTNEGGWFELLLIIVIILIWIIATAVMTTDNSIAATITGSGCYYYAPAPIAPTSSPLVSSNVNDSTTIQNLLNLIQESKRFVNNTNTSFDCFLSIENITYSCDSFVVEDDNNDDSIKNNVSNGNNSSITDNDTTNLKSLEAIPGSNLYIFLWINLLTSFHLVSRWKAQQALQFARTQQQQQLKATGTAPQNLTTTSTNDGRTPRNDNNKKTFNREEAEDNDVEQFNENDGSEDNIDDFDDDDRY